MDVSTKQIIKGVITVEGNQVNTGISRSELERILNTKIKVDSDHVGYVLGSELLVEDGKPVSFTAWFKNDNVRKLELNIGRFRDDDAAYEYLEEWLVERGLTEWVGDSYYRTEFGSLIPTLVRGVFGYFEIGISLEYREIPTRKFSPIKENKSNSLNFVVDGSEYKIQRIPCSEEEMLYLHNLLGSGPQGISNWDEPSRNDRKEVIYFNISKIENDTESIIGIAEFTYFAVWDAYKDSELFVILDSLTEEWGIIGFAIQKYKCSLKNKKGFTPYVLAFETFHDEIPHNKELEVFMENDNAQKLFLESVRDLTSKYVEIPEEDMTLISVSRSRDSVYSYYKKVAHIYVNYQRTEKVETVTK